MLPVEHCRIQCSFQNCLQTAFDLVGSNVQVSKGEMKAQLDKKTVKNTHDEGRQGLLFSSIVERNLGLRSVVYLRFSRKLVTMLMTTDHISSQYERSVRKRLGQLSQSGQSKRPSLEREYVARAGPVHLWALSKKCFG